MHQCLKVPEILALIFESLLSSGDWGDGRESLARTARTCATFNEPSIRVLWRRLPTLYPLSSLFPDNSWRRDMIGTLFIDNPSLLQESETVSRIRRYTRLVQQIDYADGDYEVDFHHSALHNLYTHLGRFGPIFPNATTVQIPCSASNPLEAIFYPAVVLSPAVRHITIFSYDDVNSEPRVGHEWQAVVNRLQPIIGDLLSLKVFADDLLEWRNRDLAHINELCCQLRGPLQRLNLQNYILTPTTLRLIARLENLQELEIAAPPHSMPFATRSLSFPELKSLTVGIPSPDSCDSFIRQVSAPVLDTLKLCFSFADREMSVNLDAAFEALSETDAHQLSQIDVTSCYSNNYRAEFLLTRSAFQHLSSFKHITSFKISLCAELELEDGDVVGLFKAWPELTSFALTPASMAYSDFVHHTNVTMSGIHAALQYCPRLETLELACDARRVLSNVDGNPHSALSHWNVFNSPIGLGIEVGELLATWYPRLSATGLEYFKFARAELCSSSLRESAKFLTPDGLEAAMMIDQWNYVVNHLYSSKLIC